VNHYDKVLAMDVDIMLQQDISEVFNYEYIAWRKNLAWDANEAFKNVFDGVDYLIAGSGGIILFSKELRQHNISKKKIVDGYIKTVNVPSRRGGVDEHTLLGIVYGNKIPLSLLPLEYNMPALDKKVDDARIVHFVNPISKPWENYAMIFAFPEWAQNNVDWCSWGGDSPVLSKGFDTTAELVQSLVKREKELEKKEKKLKSEIKELKKAVEEKEQIIRIIFDKEKQIDDLQNSSSYKLGRAISYIPRKLRDLVK